tara:strand:- start:250 stop:432 length:183 start_codon:yes stop_codon:yes gene_type:complete
MKVGDLVVCNCKANTWYKGQVGTLVWFGPAPLVDPYVMYGNGTVIRLAKSGLEVLNGKSL